MSKISYVLKAFRNKYFHTACIFLCNMSFLYFFINLMLLKAYQFIITLDSYQRIHPIKYLGYFGKVFFMVSV